MTKPLFVVVESFLCTLDTLNLTTERSMPTESLIDILKRLGYEFPEDCDE